jgi:signal transduction histidine kinase
VFLDDFYRAIKTGQIKSTASDMEKLVEKGDRDGLETYLYNLDYSSDYCALVFEKNNAKNYELVVSEEQLYKQDYSTQKVCNLNGIDDVVINKLLHNARESGGEKTEVLEQNYGLYEKSETFTSMNYGKLFEVKDDNSYFVFVSGRLTPIEETVSTLQRQLLIITGVLIFLSLIVAYIIGEITSKPIHKTNEKAKKLAEGKLDIHFDGKGYLEIDELNETLNYAVQELSKVETLRNELIANMSHDLRTPLTMIGGYSEVIRDLPGEDTKENIQVIIDETKRLTNLVNNILDLSKLQANTEELKTEQFNLTELIRSTVTRLNKMIENDNYEIIFESNEEVFVNADHDKVNQVIYNILGNAIHYTGEDKKVYVRQIVLDNRVRIEVEDTGKGIKQEDIPYVWDRYYQLKKNHKRQELGTGLGLSIVKGILELHNARYGVISEKGKGAIFYFELFIESKK